MDDKAEHGIVQDNGRNSNIVSAYSYNTGITLATEACREKGNEIKAIPQLIDKISISGKIVTADAMSMQKDIIDKIRKKGGDFQIELKANQRSLRYGVEDRLKGLTPAYSYTDGPELGHGRIETRTYRLFDGLAIICDKEKWVLWFKIIVACIPAAVVGLLFDDILEKYLYNPITVAVMLILFGIGFILVENGHKGKRARVRSLAQLTYKDAIIIGLFQLIAAIFPGTSRSGATILGGLMIGVSRTVAAEFTFFLAIPVMLGASLLKVIRFGFAFSMAEAVILLVGMAIAFIVSVLVIRFLMGYIKKHDFKVFGWYRIVLGILVLLYFFVIK